MGTKWALIHWSGGPLAIPRGWVRNITSTRGNAKIACIDVFAMCCLLCLPCIVCAQAAIHWKPLTCGYVVLFLDGFRKLAQALYRVFKKHQVLGLSKFMKFLYFQLKPRSWSSVYPHVKLSLAWRIAKGWTLWRNAEGYTSESHTWCSMECR